MGPRQRVGQQPGTDAHDAADEQRSEHPVEEELSAMSQGLVHRERGPASSAQPVRSFDFAKRRHEKHGGGRQAGCDERPQPVEPQQRREADG